MRFLVCYPYQTSQFTTQRSFNWLPFQHPEQIDEYLNITYSTTIILLFTCSRYLCCHTMWYHSPIAARVLLSVVALLRGVGTRWGIRGTRWRVCTTLALGVTCWRVSTTLGLGVTCRWVALSWRLWVALSWWRWWIATIRLAVCWLRWDRLIDAGHLLHWRHCHGLWAELPIPLVHFNFVLCLHTGANRAVDHIRQARKDLGSL